MRIPKIADLMLLISLMDVILMVMLIYRALADPTNASIGRRSSYTEDADLPPAISRVCEGGTNATKITHTAPSGTDGIMMTKGICMQFDSTVLGSSPVEDRDLRQPQSCPIAPNKCVARFGNTFQGNGWVSKCGATCTSTCYPGTGGPNPYDCKHIMDSLANNSTKLFVLQPNEFLLLTYASCGTSIQNQNGHSSVGCPQTMIYDTVDWSRIGMHLAFNCQSLEGANGGICTGDTRLFQNIPDYFIQVFANS